MALMRTRQNRSRLNLLVELFEKGAKTDSLSVPSMSIASNRPGKLSTSKLQTLTAVTSKRALVDDVSSQEPQSKSSSSSSSVTTCSSVNQLITSFESRKKVLESRVISSKKAAITSPRGSTMKYPEVTRLVREIFNAIMERFHDDHDIAESCPSEHNVTEKEETEYSEEDCSPREEEEAFTWTESTISRGKIGALWTQDALDSISFNNEFKTPEVNSNFTEFCTKQLSHLIEQYSGDNDKATQYCSVQERVQKILSSFQQQQQQEEETFTRSADISVRTYKALIEMTVLKEESFEPTVSTVNRVPCVPVLEEQEFGGFTVNTQFC
eukprot:g6438.t1